MATGRSTSRAGYWVGASIVTVGVVAAVVWVVFGLVGFARTVDHLQRVPLAGGGSVTFARAGAYTMYYEGPGTSDETGIPNFTVSLAAVDGGRLVDLSDYGGSLTYDFGSHHGRATATFRIDTPGRYTIGIAPPSAGPGQLAVGAGIGSRLLVTIVGALVIGLIGVAAGATVLIVTAVRRRRARVHQPFPPSSPVPQG